MTLAISTSSPVVSVALFDAAGSASSEFQLSNRNASELVIRFTDQLLLSASRKLADVREIVVDRGPGSFTGVKVGITIAKVWADAIGADLFSIDSFDLIAIDSSVVVPHKRNAFILRTPGEAPQPIEAPNIPSGVIGYGIPNQNEQFPEANKAWLSRDEWIESLPRLLVPNYVVEPSISMPKAPYRSS